jgi:hypothetical protein
VSAALRLAGPRRASSARSRSVQVVGRFGLCRDERVGHDHATDAGLQGGDDLGVLRVRRDQLVGRQQERRQIRVGDLRGLLGRITAAVLVLVATFCGRKLAALKSAATAEPVDAEVPVAGAGDAAAGVEAASGFVALESAAAGAAEFLSAEVDFALPFGAGAGASAAAAAPAFPAWVTTVTSPPATSASAPILDMAAMARAMDEKVRVTWTCDMEVPFAKGLWGSRLASRKRTTLSRWSGESFCKKVG